MIFIDKNQTLRPPEGFELHRFGAHGSYLRLEYWREDQSRTDIVVVFLNDQGREVGRASWTIEVSPPIDWSENNLTHVQASNKVLASIKFWIRRISECLKK